MSETIIPALPGTFVIWWDPYDDDDDKVLMPWDEALGCTIYKIPVVAWVCRSDDERAPLVPLTMEGADIGDKYRQAVLFPDGSVCDPDTHDSLDAWRRSAHHYASLAAKRAAAA